MTIDQAELCLLMVELGLHPRQREGEAALLADLMSGVGDAPSGPASSRRRTAHAGLHHGFDDEEDGAEMDMQRPDRFEQE